MRYLKHFESIERRISLREFITLYVDDAKIFIRHKDQLSIDKIENPQEFLEEYMKMALKNKQWIGGPLNLQWTRKYHKMFGLKEPYIQWKPTVDIRLYFQDKTSVSITFAIMSKRIQGFNTDSGEFSFDSMASTFLRRFDTQEFTDMDKPLSYKYDYFYKLLHHMLPSFDFNWKVPKSLYTTNGI